MSEISSFNKREYAKNFALQIIKKRGAEVAEKLPNIKSDAEAGLSLKDIAKKYNIAETYTVTEKIASGIIGAALRILIPDASERKSLYDPRTKEAQRQLVRKNKDGRVGIFSLTPEQQLQHQRAGGRAVATRRIGAHAQHTYALNTEDGSIVIAGGNVPRPNAWFGAKKIDGLDEGNFVLGLIKKENFKIKIKGANFGQPDYPKIVEAVNEKYGNNRTRGQVRSFVANVKATYSKRKQNS